jgi:hypothetical protein
MKPYQLQALREWVQAEIEAAFEYHEEDEAGYRGTSQSAKDKADETFNNFRNLIL